MRRRRCWRRRHDSEATRAHANVQHTVSRHGQDMHRSWLCLRFIHRGSTYLVWSRARNVFCSHPQRCCRQWQTCSLWSWEHQLAPFQNQPCDCVIASPHLWSLDTASSTTTGWPARVGGLQIGTTLYPFHFPFVFATSSRRSKISRAIVWFQVRIYGRLTEHLDWQGIVDYFLWSNKSNINRCPSSRTDSKFSWFIRGPFVFIRFKMI